jgi:tRNA threonylcarbamoyl adenosine modification protein (Sua5/YciO/YrdC/YwlC family)
VNVSRGPQAETFERCMSVGGVAVFPADTVYGLACDPGDRVAVERLYALKGRSLDKPSAVMFFDLERALAALPELRPRTRDALARLFPGPVSVLLANPLARYPLACGSDPSTLGVRVVAVPSLAGVRWPVLQSSANLAGQPDARTLSQVPERFRRECEMVIDGGELPGTPSTVVDLRAFEDTGEWSIVRPGGMGEGDVRTALTGQYHFDPAGYAAMIRDEIPHYDEFQDVVARAGAVGARRVLDLGTGTGETAARLLAGNPDASLVGVDESEAMLRAASERLADARVQLIVGRLQDPLPPGRFDLVASALCVHHLDSGEKRSLFARVREALAPGGRFVLADVIVPADPVDQVIELTAGYDRPDPLSDQLGWLAAAGFAVTVEWTARDLAVVVCEREPPSGPPVGSDA